ncbi:MAG: sugar phosphate isomerase/epimerase family protein [Thermoguttaceae bacterium]|jgi:sugar phosphate isomerase/epimerase
MTINRRGFLAGSAAAVAGASIVRAAQASSVRIPPPPREAALKLSSQLGVIPGKELPEKLAWMEKAGFDAVEPHGNIVGQEKEFLAALRNSKLKVSALCWGSAKGALVSRDAAKRADAVVQFKRAIDTAAELHSTGVIHAPVFKSETDRTNQEIREILVDTLPAIGEYAVKAGTRVLLEPLNRKEAFFLRQVADGAAICRDCNNPGICLMADFYHMAVEETSCMGALLSGGAYLHHIHLASKTRVLPGQDPEEDEPRYLDGFRGLKLIGYQDYCSFECGCRGNREEEIPKSMAFLRRLWEQA